MNCSLLIKLSFCLVICALNFRLKFRGEKWLNIVKSWILSIYLTEPQDNINSRFIWVLVFSLKSINNLSLFLANDQPTLPGVPSCAYSMHTMAPSALIHCILACSIALACAAPRGVPWGLKVEPCVLFVSDLFHWNYGGGKIQKAVFLKYIVYFPWMLVWMHGLLWGMVKYGS